MGFGFANHVTKEGTVSDNLLSQKVERGNGPNSEPQEEIGC